MPRLSPPHPNRLTPEQKRVHDAIVSGPRGVVEGPCGVWLHSPEFADLAQNLGRYCRFDSSVPKRLLEIAILVTAALWRAKFEWWAHSRMARDAGVREAVIEAIRRGDERVHESFKSDNLSDLQIDISALYLLAAPGTPEPVREAVVERAREGERITHADAKAVVQIARWVTKDAQAEGRLPTVSDIRRAVREATGTADIPTPAKARKQAAESGLMVLDNTGHYRVPPDAIDEAKARDRPHWHEVVEAVEALSACPLTAERLRELTPAYYDRSELLEQLARASGLLAAFREELSRDV
jgi:Carboxymuconolactone decarboxylase family